MKRHLIKLMTGLILIVIVGALVFTGCAEEEEPPPPPPPPPPVEEEEEPPPPPVEEVWEWPEHISLVRSSGMGVIAAQSWSSVLAASTGMRIRIVSEDNTTQRFKWLAEGRFFSNADGQSVVVEHLEANVGKNRRDAGPFQIRMIWASSRNNSGYMTRGDSDLYTIKDIKPGTRLVSMSFGSATMDRTWRAVLAWAQVDWDDIVWVPASSFGAVVRMVVDGRADLCFNFPTGGAAYEAAAAPHGIRWLELPYDEDPEGAKRYLDVQPTHSFGVMFMGEPSAIGVKSIVNISPDMTSTETDPELVYQWAKWMDENYDSFKDTHANNISMSLDVTMRLTETSFVPPHEGLVRDPTELGKWTPAHEARRQQNIDLLTKYEEAYQDALDMADDQGILVDPENEEWAELWENYKQELGLPGFSLFLGL